MSAVRLPATIVGRLPTGVPLKVAAACSSRCHLVRWNSTATPRPSILDELDTQLHPRAVIELKQKEYEEKYGAKLRAKAQAEGVKDLDALKEKLMAPSVRRALKAKSEAKKYREAKAADAAPAVPPSQESREKTTSETATQQTNGPQAKGDRAGVKPLSSILNMPLINSQPHTSADVARIWNAYHVSHPTLAFSFLSASLPTEVYSSMLYLARSNPYFVLPLPRTADETGAADGQVKTDSYEMFYLQWLFHPTESTIPAISATGELVPLPMTSSVIFTPLEEFKKAGEWAQPHLVLTHYADLSHSHGTVLMRGEISAAAASGPQGSSANPGFLLSQQQAQLLALALQRFYCTLVVPPGESVKASTERLQRGQALRDFRERPDKWDWQGLVEKAYGGLV